MTESSRPPESSAIDEGLRIRLEGDVELLERALPSFDALHRVLESLEPSPDDVATLQQWINSLPRIDAALEESSRHEPAIALTRAIHARKAVAHAAANARLEFLGKAVQPSLRAALSKVLQWMQQQGLGPGHGETRLMASPTPPLGVGVIAGIVLAALTSPVLATPWNVLLGLLGSLLWLRAMTPRPWVLLPDRMYFPALWPARPSQVTPAQLEDLTTYHHFISAQVPGEQVELHTPVPLELLALLVLLRGPWLSGLLGQARPSVLLDAEGGAPGQAGRALVTAQGVLFLSMTGADAAARSLTPEVLLAPPGQDKLLALLAHVPDQRWGALGTHLAAQRGALWLRRGEISVEPSNPGRGVRLRSSSGQVRLIFPAKAGDDRQARAEVLVAALKA